MGKVEKIEVYRTHMTEQQFGLSIGEQFLRIHSPEKCEGKPCVIHHPSDHHMVTWMTNWRGDLQMMERLCEHGIGHPDPDDLAYRKSVWEADIVSKGGDPKAENGGWLSVHGCDGCCGSRDL